MENIIKINDSEIVAGILQKSFITVARQFNFSRENAPRFPAFIKPEQILKQLNEGLSVYGYSMNGKIAGCAGYSPMKDKNYLIERVATLPEYRHLGIGGKLMSFVERQILEEGGEKAEVHVVDINKVLVEWYKSLGYTVIRTEEIKTAPFNSLVLNKDLKFQCCVC